MTVDLALERVDPKVSQIFQILDEVPFCVADLTDNLLPLLLLVADAVRNFLWYAVNPQLLLVGLVDIVIVDRSLSFLLEASSSLKVQLGHLLEAARASNRVAELIGCACWRVAFGKKDENTIDRWLFVIGQCFPELVHFVG